MASISTQLISTNPAKSSWEQLKTAKTAKSVCSCGANRVSNIKKVYIDIQFYIDIYNMVYYGFIVLYMICAHDDEDDEPKEIKL